LNFNNLFFLSCKTASSPYINHFLQPDTIVPGATNPQAWNRYSYVLNNPLRYIDPTGHYCVGDDEDCADEGGDGPAPIVTGGNNGGNGGGSGDPHDDDDFDPNPNCVGCGVVNEPEVDYLDSILGDLYTPVAAAAVQVLSGTVFAFSLWFAETPIGLGVAIGAFIVNRGSSMVGLASTFYQYQHQQNGTVFTDVVVSGGTFLLGWIPSLTEPLAIASLIYSGYRLENDAPIDIPAPNY